MVQFVVIAILMFPFFVRFTDPVTGSFKPHMYSAAPMKEYVMMAAIFFVSSVAANKAFELGVSQPFNVIFRSLSLLVSYVIGAAWFGRRYSKQQLLAVVLVTAGVLVTTLGELILQSGVGKASCCEDMAIWSKAYYWIMDPSKLESPAGYTLADLFWFVLSLFLLSLTIIGLAVLGHLQGKSYREYKCRPEENMFYLHLLSLPLFSIISGDLLQHLQTWNTSASTYYLGTGLPIPWLWVLAIANAATQIICLFGVHYVTSSMGTLACTFATTVRKFISLIFSVIYFQNPFTSIHTAGAVCVFIGTYLFATAPSESNATTQTAKQKKD